jgi:hypothetical protein
MPLARWLKSPAPIETDVPFRYTRPPDTHFFPGQLNGGLIMAIPHSQIGNGFSASLVSDPSRDHERRLLELQLTRLRSEALAARLEAQAAEVEIRLRCLNEHDSKRSPVAIAPLPAVAPRPDIAPLPAVAPFSPVTAAPRVNTVEAFPVVERSKLNHAPSVEQRKPIAPEKLVKPAQRKPAPRVKTTRPVPVVVATSEEASPPSSISSVELLKSPVIAQADRVESQQRRSSPLAVVTSASVHVLLLLVLAFVSLKLPSPRDQVALTAASDAAEPEPLAAVTIETEQPQVDPVEPTQSDAKVEFDATVPTSAEALAVSDSNLTPLESLLGSASSAMASASLQVTPTSGQKMTFCGVEGGGNHFVYLVDCSKSMGAAFESARAELIQSIEALKPDQRFYVVFFDEHPDYMRITDPNADESESVLATAENKRALMQWAMKVTMDSGKAPYDPLKFALNLGPDVIFLLSDGEFPAGIESLLSEGNHVENLFGDQQIRSIVHTIGYHSQEGEARMRAIAQQNQGQYRHVPRPEFLNSP